MREFVFLRVFLWHDFLKIKKFENYVFDCFQNATDFEFLKTVYRVTFVGLRTSPVSFFGSFRKFFSEVFRF